MTAINGLELVSPKYQWIPVPDTGHDTEQQVILIVMNILNLVNGLATHGEREREREREGGEREREREKKIS